MELSTPGAFSLFFFFLCVFFNQEIVFDTFCRTSSTDLYFPALIRKACWLILRDIAENPLKSGSAMGSLKLWVSWYHSLHLDFLSPKCQSWYWCLWGFTSVTFRQVASLILGVFFLTCDQICCRVTPHKLICCSLFWQCQGIKKKPAEEKN